MDIANCSIRNARHNGDGSIDLELEHPEWGWIPFTAVPDDSEQHGRAIHARALAGDAGDIAPYVPPSEEELAANARAERDHLLLLSDWTQLPDVPQATKDLWAPYRQALRDVPEQAGFPHEVEWPTPPQG